MCSVCLLVLPVVPAAWGELRGAARAAAAAHAAAAAAAATRAARAAAHDRAAAAASNVPVAAGDTPCAGRSYAGAGGSSELLLLLKARCTLLLRITRLLSVHRKQIAATARVTALVQRGACVHMVSAATFSSSLSVCLRAAACVDDSVALQPPQANSWNARSPSNAGGGSPAPDDWEIDISQLHIDSKVCGWVCLLGQQQQYVLCKCLHGRCEGTK
jgi:hypothetical protein